jgi:hypothetical protein
MYKDTTTGNIKDIEGLEVYSIIASVILSWMSNKYGGTIDEKGNLWLS